MVTREELVEQLQAEELDDLVHDMKSLEASNINNEGVESQIDYLLAGGMSLEEIEKAVKVDPEADASDQE